VKLLHRLVAVTVSIPFVFLFCGFGSGTARTAEAPIIVTAAPAYDALAALHGGDRFPQGAQLLMVRSGIAEPLVAGFAATADANVSFDAKSVLFAGKHAASDPWQVWELTLADRSVRKVIAASSDVIRPLYLPGSRVVYARHTDHGFQLEAAQLDGTATLPLTYMRSSALPSDVLADGRILFEAGFPLGSGSTPELYLVYSDGSGVESYRCDHGAARWGGRQLATGDVVFTHGSTLARFTSPLATEGAITTPRAEFAGDIAETSNGAWMVSAKSAGSAHYALKLWKPASALFMPVFARTNEDIVEPVLVAPRTTPKRHPSALHDWDYANLLALDARQSRDGALSTVPATVRLETLDSTGHAVNLGTSPVEKDGSFFVKTPADRAIRFVLLDEKGAVIREEHGFFWARRGEQHICVGCHAGPEHAPENNVPAVLLRSTNPVDLTGIAAANAAPQSSSGGRSK
jgi:hypothetical protein